MESIFYSCFIYKSDGFGTIPSRVASSSDFAPIAPGVSPPLEATVFPLAQGVKNPERLQVSNWRASSQTGAADAEHAAPAPTGDRRRRGPVGASVTMRIIAPPGTVLAHLAPPSTSPPYPETPGCIERCMRERTDIGDFRSRAIVCIRICSPSFFPDGYEIVTGSGGKR